ncbi:MAG: DUF4115 domain-containing protein [Phascolarctobacterium sp.]|nr:DUF4115 domain-containing protein [Phascolarctobacterium sp.]
MDGTIGNILKQTREAKQLTLEQVSEATSYRVKSLEMLENDDYSGYPSMVYVKGLIRGYGNYLGLDGIALVNEFKETAEYKNSTVETIGNVHVAKDLNLKQEPGVGTSKSYVKDSKKFPTGQFLLGVLICCFMYVGYSYTPEILAYFNGKTVQKEEIKVETKIFDEVKDKFTNIYETVVNLVNEFHTEEHSKKTETISQNNVHTVQPKLQVQEPVVPPSKPVEKKSQQVNAIAARQDRVVVELTASGQCWIDVFADGKAVYSGMMTKGRYKIFDAKKRITVKYGNISVMQVTVNGKPVNMRGEAGVTTKHYPR